MLPNTYNHKRAPEDHSTICLRTSFTQGHSRNFAESLKLTHITREVSDSAFQP